MQAPGVERRLAAIAADMVGYSRLMEADETGTLARLRTHRLELIDPSIAKNKGRMIKTTGDGMLVEFQSVTEAVQCAVEVQKRMARRNADVAPARWIQFRIGINLGDVIVDGNDILGDGVNVAARPRDPGRARRRMRLRRGAPTRSVPGSTSPSPISASKRSRTLSGRSTPMPSCSTAVLPPRHPRRPRPPVPPPPSPRSRCCPSPT